MTIAISIKLNFQYFIYIVSIKQGIRRVAIVSACRTAVGGFGGSLKSVRAPQLAAVVMREAV
jgi:hypothetical protein